MSVPVRHHIIIMHIHHWSCYPIHPIPVSLSYPTRQIDIRFYCKTVLKGKGSARIPKEMRQLNEDTPINETDRPRVC